MFNQDSWVLELSTKPDRGKQNPWMPGLSLFVEILGDLQKESYSNHKGSDIEKHLLLQHSMILNS